MSRGLILTLLLGGLWPMHGAIGQETDTLVLSLAEAERRALADSPLLASAVAGLDLSRAQRTRAGHARFLPEFNLRNVWGPVPSQRGEFTDAGVLFSPDSSTSLGDLSWFTQVDLQIVQPLYTFGKAGARIDAVEHQVEISRSALDKTRSEVLLLVRQLYWGVVLTDELERVVRSVLDRVAEAEVTLQEQYEEGDASQNDMFKFRLFQYDIGRRAREVEGGAIKARSGLRAAMGLEEGVPFRVEDTSLEPMDVALDSLSTYLIMAESSRPELSQLRSGIAARNSLVRAANSDSKPTLFLAAEIKFNEAPDRFDPENPFWRNQTNFFRPGIVLGFDWNLNFMQHSDKARVERFELVKLEAQVEPLRLMVRQQVRETYLDALRARADIDDGRSALQASENWLRAELQTFDLGLGSIDDVIKAFDANVGMTIEQLRNIAKFNTLVAELSQRTGREIN